MTPDAILCFTCGLFLAFVMFDALKGGV